MSEENVFQKIYNFFIGLYETIRYRLNPDWQGPVPPIPCQFCGQTDHDEKGCPNYEAMGFPEYFSPK